MCLHSAHLIPKTGLPTFEQCSSPGRALQLSSGKCGAKHAPRPRWCHLPGTFATSWSPAAGWSGKIMKLAFFVLPGKSGIIMHNVDNSTMYIVRIIYSLELCSLHSVGAAGFKTTSCHQILTDFRPFHTTNDHKRQNCHWQITSDYVLLVFALHIWTKTAMISLEDSRVVAVQWCIF